MLRERALRHQLFALQLGDAVLQIGNLGFVDFDGRLRRHAGPRRFCRRGRAFSAREPHDQDHEHGEAGEQPRLHVLRQQPGRLRRFFLDFDGFGHRSRPQFATTRRVNVSFFLPTAR